MAINICNKYGNHIGIVHKRFPYAKNVYLIALTDIKGEELNIDIDKIKTKVAW